MQVTLVQIQLFSALPVLICSTDPWQSGRLGDPSSKRSHAHHQICVRFFHRNFSDEISNLDVLRKCIFGWNYPRWLGALECVENYANSK